MADDLKILGQYLFNNNNLKKIEISKSTNFQTAWTHIYTGNSWEIKKLEYQGCYLQVPIFEKIFRSN